MPTISEKLLSNIQKRTRSSSQSSDSSEANESVNRITTGRKTLDDIMTQISFTDRTRFKHHFIPNFNACQQPVANLKELQDFPSITISMPHPVYVAPKHCDHIDICHLRPMKRHHYFKRLHHARTSYLTALKKRKTRADQKNGIYPSSLFDFAERLESNPDPFFNCSYDYYYAGGNLCVLPNSKNVVHTAGDGLKDIVISSFPSKKDMQAVLMRQLHSKTLGKSSEILQVIPFLTQRDEQPNCFATRERNSITVHCFNEENEVKGLTQYNNASTPFISFAQSAGDFNKFIITNMKQNVRLFDINSSKSTLSKLYEAGSESWNVVKPWREHTFLYANSKQLMLMDVRTDPAEWRKNKCVFAKDELFCQQISNLALSNFKNQFYVGTSHKLYCLDIRCWGKTFEGPATVCRWIHMLEYPPLFLEAFRGHNSEYLALSGPLADDFRICELMRDGKLVDNSKKKAKLDTSQWRQKYKYKSLSLPYLPTTLMEAYRAARLRAKCLNPEANLPRRLKFCTTGLAFYENRENKYNPSVLLRSNSLGDVFAYKLGVRQSQAHEPRTSAITDSVMCKYEERICALEPPPLNYTHVENMRAMSKVFRCAKLDYNASAGPLVVNSDNENIDINEEAVKRPKSRLGRWQKSMSALHSYKDVLAKELLSIWDIDFDQESHLHLSELTKKERMKPESKELVSEWLNSIADEPPMISIPSSVINDSLIAEASQSEQRTLIDSSLERNQIDSSLQRNQIDSIEQRNQIDSSQLEFLQSAKEVPQSTQQLNELSTFQNQFTEFVILKKDEEDSMLNVSNINLNELQMNETAATTTIRQSTSDKRQTTQKRRRKSYVKGF